MSPASRPLRIVIAIGEYGLERGGASEWVQHFANWLARRGHHVSIACQQAEAAPPENCELATLTLSQRTKNSWRRASVLQQLVKQCPADIVHDTGCLWAADVFHPLMGSLLHNWHRELRTHTPTGYFRRLWRVRMWRDFRLQWHQMRRCRRLVACSKGVAADFARLGCKTAVVIRNGIRLLVPLSASDIARLREKLGVGNRLLAIVTANNFRLKGVRTVLGALAMLEKSERERFLVLIAGHNRDGSYQRFIDEHGLRDCCRLMGWVSDIEPLYQAAGIFLHPTHHDSGSLSTLKAIAAGCAVVTSRFDGSAEVIRDGVEGVVLNQPSDPNELKGILTRLLDANLRNRLATAARQLAPAVSEDNCFGQLEALYFRLLERAGA
ncbi:MAG: glycosyltransferase family 4 protein [Verrucomicrobia bacterium]|nr:glycosyltransferase family 4 protein [Verrucomicrobiota bacterium]